VKYNQLDGIWYLTNAERLALDITKLQDTAKYYEVDTKQAFIVYNGQWYPF
jgi:argininosuccinate synthase